ncbi:MAG TPA: class I adenylate-forming enzyme family protein [Myxococcota bacterium]
MPERARELGALALALQPDASRLTLPRFLDDIAARHGERVALRFEGCDLSYAQLRAEARAVARGLVAAGIARGEHVAVLFANRPEWAICALGAALAGAVVVPLSTFATPAERAFLLAHSDAVALLYQRALLARDFAAELRAAPRPARLRLLACWGEQAFPRAAGANVALEAELEARAASVAPSDPGLLLYTSGTTAEPKGVLHPQRAPVIQSWRFAELMDLTPDDRVLSAQPLFWTAGIAMSLGATLAAGATLLLQESFEPGAALALIERERATTLHAWPHQEQAMAAHPEAVRRDLASLRKLEFTSALAAHARLERDEWGIYASFGATESFTLASALPARAPAAQRRASHGAPLPGNELRILHPETGAQLGAGCEGEIALRGPTLMIGYWKQPRAAAFDTEGFWHSGDTGWLDARGRLHWRGRASGMIKTGGANVSPLEVEAALAAFPGVKSAHALGVPHPALGEALVLCVVLSAESPRGAISLDAVREFLRPQLAGYKLPRALLAFAAREVAYTGSQKVALAALRERALERLAAEGTEIAGHRYGSERRSR